MASNIFKIFGEIAINNSEANRSIDSTGMKAKNLSSGMKSEFDKIGKFALKLGKTVAVGMAGISTAIGALLKNSIDEFADKEQLEGGVETLFKDSAAKVKRYAANAYKTAGMSANQYMETVTSFSARLLQGLGGDTEAAAEMANMAITDMADNANKMGTDMSSIENAYQGFAKQNYTMLDNLKLGYGGTASEMARLINDSGVLGDTMTLTADNVNSVSFDTIIQAIHNVQTEMDITGTTAKEAEGTISGSFNSMKAAWQNLISGMSTGDSKIAHIRRSDTFVESVNTWVSNIKQPILNFIENFPDTVSAILPTVTSAALDIGSAIIAEIYNGITGSKITSEEIKEAILKVVNVAGDVGENVLSFVTDAFGWIKNNKTAVMIAVSGIAGAFIAFKFATNPVGATIDLIVAGLTLLVTNWNSVKDAINRAIKATKEFLGLSNEPAHEGQFGGAEQKAAVDDWIAAMREGNEELMALTWKGVEDAMGGMENAADFKRAYMEYLYDNADSTGDDYILDVPAEWFEGTEDELQDELDKMDIKANVVAGWANNAQAMLQNGLSSMFLTADVSTVTTMKPISGISRTSEFVAGGLDLLSRLPGHASGLDFVPRDNYLARLHYGEAVLTHSEANDWRRGQKNGDGMNMEMLAEMITSAISERPVAINIDGKAFATIMSRQMSKAIGNRNIQQLMSMGG